MESVLPIVIMATFRLEADRLILQYRVENTSNAQVYLVNRLTRYEDPKGWVPDPAVAYVFIEDEGRIEIAKRVPPVPDRLVTPRTYYVTPLPPGGMMQEELSFPLPLREHRPYDSLVKPLPLAERTRATITLVCGFFPAHPTVRAEPVTVHGVATHRLARGPVSTQGGAEPSHPPKELLVRSSPWETELPVIRLPRP